MEGSRTDLFAMMQQRMRYLSQRQAVIAQNVANADTPGYKPQDLKPLDFKAMMGDAGGLAPRATHPSHMSMGGGQGSAFRAREQENLYEISPSGNAVVLEEEALKLSATQLDYQTTTSMYRKYTEMLRLAAGSGGQ